MFGFRKRPGKRRQPDKEHEEKAEAGQNRIPSEVSELEELIKNIFSDSSDLVAETFDTKAGEVLLVYIDGLVNKDVIDRDIITPLKSRDFDGDFSLGLKAIYRTADDIPALTGEVVNGNAAIFYRDSRKALIVDFKQWDRRAVEAPDSEAPSAAPRRALRKTSGQTPR